MSELHSHSAHPSASDGHAVGQAIDLADELQAQLDEVRGQLEWSNRLSQLGMLTASLAHEINNLITPIRSYAQLGLANPGNEQLTERALRAAMSGAEKAGRLTERVIDLALPGHQDKAEACRVNEVVEDAIHCMLPAAKQQRVNIMSRVEPCDAGLNALALEQVLINLISNACQAMSKTQGKRQLMIESHLSNECLMLMVSDSGAGIPESIQASLFEPFVSTAAEYESPTDPAPNRVDRQEASQRKGSGLGLSICKQIIESVGGQIRLAESQVGARFEIELPSAVSE